MQNDNAQLISTSGAIVFYRPPPEPNGEFPPEKYFADDSYWYMKIKQNPKIASNNDDMIDWIMGIRSYPMMQWQSWTHPVYNAYEDTPVYHIYVKDYGHYIDVPLPDPYPVQIPVETDAAVSVIDWYRGMTWSLEVVNPVGGTYEINSYNNLPIGGSGIQDYGGPWRGGGSGCAKLSYMIRPEEIEAGVINHALGFSAPPTGPWSDGSRFDTSEGFVYPPAVHTDGETTSSNPFKIPQGARVQLDPAIDLDALYGVNPTGSARTAKIIAKCLQDYGAVHVESGGTVAIYCEHDFTAEWNGPGPAMSANILSAISGLKTSSYNPWRVIDFELYPEIDDMSEYVSP